MKKKSTSMKHSKSNRLSRKALEKLTRQHTDSDDEGGTLMRGTRTHKSERDYNRQAEKRRLQNWDKWDD